LATLFVFGYFCTMISPKDIFNIKTEDDFQQTALKVFKFQFENNTIYRSYCDLLYIHPSDVKHIEDIPFLPIQFFKSHQVISSPSIETTFTSSGTTGSITSKLHVSDISIYETSFRRGFEHFYGAVEDYAILALLPSYLERTGNRSFFCSFRLC